MGTDLRERLDLQGWVELIRDRDMPVFGRTVQTVRAVTEDENSNAAALAQAILQDAALTTKVLKLANSALFNSQHQQISTVSRAIVLMGFRTVGDIVLSIYLVDALLSGGLRDRVTAEMARCFHAAVQARTAAQLKGAPDAEEVFVAALLAKVGDMAFWCFGGACAKMLDEALRDDPDSRPDELQRDILGFPLHSLTAELANAWGFGEMLVHAAEGKPGPGVGDQSIAMGYKLARALEDGWDTPTAKGALAQYAEFVGKPLSEVTTTLVANASDAARVAAQFGAEEAARLIPIPPAGAKVDIEAEAAEVAPDPLLQLRILRDLSGLLGGKPSLNEVLQLVLEGIYRGLGMQRAVFALMSPDRTQVLCKAALGRGAEVLQKRFSFALDGMPGEVVNEAFSRQRNFWLTNPPPHGIRIERFERVTASREAFIAPIVTAGRVIGIFFADRNGTPLDEEAWQGFQHFVQQASLSFEHVSLRAGKKQ